jgi:hypothetical protein
MSINVSKEIITGFKNDLWKDVRRLTVFQFENQKTIRRYSDEITSISQEVKFLSFLEKNERMWNFPKMLSYSDSYIEFEYLRGIRLFNFIIELNYIAEVKKSIKAYNTIALIQSILNDNLNNFQVATRSFISQQEVVPYPYIDKCLIPLNLISLISLLTVDKEEIKDDIQKLSEIYFSGANVLFRDATPKNAILNIEELYYIHYKDDLERREHICRLLEEGFFSEYLLRKSIYQFDFSGCKYFCSPIDDFVAANLHECLEWTDLSKTYWQHNLDNDLFLSSVFVRYIRFGSRKLLYRLLHKDAHNVRFIYDRETLYFNRLGEITKLLSKKRIINGSSLELIFNQSRLLVNEIPADDYFKKYIDTSNVQYYKDIFPY